MMKQDYIQIPANAERVCVCEREREKDRDREWDGGRESLYEERD